MENGRSGPLKGNGLLVVHDVYEHKYRMRRWTPMKTARKQILLKISAREPFVLLCDAPAGCMK